MITLIQISKYMLFLRILFKKKKTQSSLGRGGWNLETSSQQ